MSTSSEDLQRSINVMNEPMKRWDDAKVHAELREMAVVARQKARRLNRTKMVGRISTTAYLVGLLATKAYAKSRTR